jgi:hypothetical protein
MFAPSKYFASAGSAGMLPETPNISALDVDAASDTAPIHV